MKATREELIEGFRYLQELRESGRTNMYGAIPFMVSELRWREPLAREVWDLWVNLEDGCSTPEELTDRHRNGN